MKSGLPSIHLDSIINFLTVSSCVKITNLFQNIVRNQRDLCLSFIVATYSHFVIHSVFFTPRLGVEPRVVRDWTVTTTFWTILSLLKTKVTLFGDCFCFNNIHQ